MNLWFYIFVFSFCTFGLLINNKIKSNQKKIFEIVILIMLCVISGTRYYMGGSDYGIYKIVFDNIPNLEGFVNNFTNLHENYRTFGFENGYLFYNSLIKTLGFNFFGFTLINSIIFYVCLYKGLEKYTFNFNFVIIVFLYKLFFYNTFISMRQSITMAIFFIALKYIEEKKPLKYFMLIALASLFHNAALILFPVYFINKLEITRKKLIFLNIIFLPTLAVSFLNLPVMSLFEPVINFFENPTAIEKAENLINGTPESSIGIFHTIEYFLIMLLIILYYKKIVKIDNHSKFIIKMFLILLPIFTLFRGYESLTRVKDYFTLTYPILLGYICLIDNCKRLQLVQIITLVFCAFGFFRFIILFDSGAMIPYESYLFKGISIFK